MSEGTVAKRYARALFEIAREKNALEQFEQDLMALSQAVVASKEFQSFLQHPAIDVKVKKEKVEAIFSGRLSEDVMSLVLLLLDKRRADTLPALSDEFVRLANEARNIVDATVYTVAPLQQDELSAISEKFGKAIGKSIRLQNSNDPAIIGGLLIRIGDRLYDGSVSGKLARFKQALVQA